MSNDAARCYAVGVCVPIPILSQMVLVNVQDVSKVIPVKFSATRDSVFEEDHKK